MNRINCKIVGISSLLQNKPSEYGFDQDWVEKRASQYSDSEKEALTKLYLHNGAICQPAIHIERALIEAGKKVKIRGGGKGTFSKLFGSMVTVEPEYILHLSQEFTIHKCLCVIPASGGRIMRFRPMLENWSLKFDIMFEDEISADTIRQSLEIAGKYVGLGDWRPEKKGKFGKFSLASFEEVK